MTGDKKSAESSSKMNVKRTGKLLSKTTKSTPSTISSPPKAALATSSAKKDEVHRRRNPLNEILRRKSADTADSSREGSPPSKDSRDENAKQDARLQNEPTVEAAARIGDLERALIAAKNEQQDLQNALHDLRTNQMTAEQTIKALRQELAKASELQDMEVDSDQYQMASSVSQEDLLRNNSDLRYRIAEMEDHLLSQELSHHKAIERATSHADFELDELRARLHATEKESQERQQQLLTLKSSISMLTRSDAQVTDSDLVEMFTQLGNRVREWIISNYRRSKLQTAGVSTHHVNDLTKITPAWSSIANTERLLLFQAVVSNALMKILLESISMGIPETGAIGSIRQFAEAARHIVPPMEHHEWQRATIRMLEISKDSQTFLNIKNDRISCIAQDIDRLLFELTSIKLNTGARGALLNILNGAADLQQTLSLQKARYKTVMFTHKESMHVEFDDDTMESLDDDVMDDDGDVKTDRTFAFCVFPCLQKHGDERGETEVSNILMKAKVCCGVG